MEVCTVKRSIQAKFSTGTGQQNVLGDVTILQNSQLIVKSKTRFLDGNVLCMCANLCTLKHGIKDGSLNTQKLKLLKSACYIVGTL